MCGEVHDIYVQWLEVANTVRGGAQGPCPGSDSSAQCHQAQVGPQFAALLNGCHGQGDAGSPFLFFYSWFWILVARHYTRSWSHEFSHCGYVACVYDLEIKAHVY